MTTRERKLLRKEINFKLKSMANKESKENDFYNSSQIITERQKMYMTISKFFRTQDNRKRPNQLPFVVDRTSLPHVNLSLLSRLYDSANDTLKSSDFDKVLNAHSYRTATPFYTNPALTVDRGKVMNYSAHVGAVLHTPRYIDFLKNTPEYASTIKSSQQGSEKIRKPSPSELSCSSTTILSPNSDSRTSNVQSPSKQSSNRSKSSLSNASDSSLWRSNFNSRRSSNKITENSQKNKLSPKIETKPEENRFMVENDDKISLSNSKSRSSSVVSRSIENFEQREFASNIEFNNSETRNENEHILSSSSLSISRSIEYGNAESNKNNDDTEKFKVMDNKESDTQIAPEMERKQMKDDLHSKLLRDEEDTESSSSSLTIVQDEHIEVRPSSAYGNHSKVVLDRQNALEEDKISIEGNDTDNASTLSEKKSTVEPYGDSFLKRCDIFFNDRNLEKEDLGAIKRYFETLVKYKVINPDYVNQFGLFLEKSNFQNFTEFLQIISQYGIDIITDEQVKYIEDLIDNYQFKHDPTKNEEPTDGDRISSTNELNEEEERNQNIMRTIQRVFPIEEIMENYDFKIETEEGEIIDNIEVNESDNNDDFGEAFTRLFRTSIGIMNQNDLDNLKKLINEYDVRNEPANETTDEESGFFKEFNELFLTKKYQMNGDDLRILWRLINNEPETEVNDNSECFKALVDQYEGRVSELETDKVRDLIQAEERARETRASHEDTLEDNEDNEMMMAFRNLFRSSVGEIKVAHLEHIQRIISDHE